MPQPSVIVQFSDANQAKGLYPREETWVTEVPSALLSVLITILDPNPNPAHNWEPPVSLYSFIRVIAPSEKEAVSIVNRIQEARDPRIAQAYLEGTVCATLKVDDCPPSTAYQNSRVGGIGSDVAKHEGNNGAGEVLAVLDQGWYLKHASFCGWDLREVFGSSGNPTTENAIHGTCTLGIIGARSALLQGIAPGVGTCFLGAAVDKMGSSTSQPALIELTNALQSSGVPPNSVVLIESCYNPPCRPNGFQLPLEADQTIVPQLQKLSDLGHVVVAAAGNGIQCIDDQNLSDIAELYAWGLAPGLKEGHFAGSHCPIIRSKGEFTRFRGRKCAYG